MDRLFRIAVGLVLLGALGMAGCRQESMRRPDPYLSLEPESTDTGPAMAPEAQGFFKPGRLSGALSSEAADIEQSLGVPR